MSNYNRITFKERVRIEAEQNNGQDTVFLWDGLYLSAKL